MAKEIKAIVKIQIPAGKATPAPPIGPALAQHGLNIAEFCQKFNSATQQMQGYTIPAEVTIYKDRGKIKVLVNMFGRDTPVELDSLQIKKNQ